jgi:hypothetical protein
MQCAILGRCTDQYEKSFVGKDGKEVKYASISIVDDNAFMDSDRIFSFRCHQDVVKGLDLVGKDCKFTGVLTKDKGLLKFKCKTVVENK